MVARVSGGHPGEVPFRKWSAAGNDFVLIDERDLAAGTSGAELARRICPRGVAVGADGLILHRGSQARLWNPDGSEPRFCGNGARCLAAQLMGTRREVRFRLGEVTVVARRRRGAVSVQAPAPRLLSDAPPATLLARALRAHRAELQAAAWVDAGVPHLLLIFRGAAAWLESAAALTRIGALLRGAPFFGAQGTNVDLLWPRPGARRACARTWAIRTYERGVEGETLACGTAAVAAGGFLLGRGAAGRAAQGRVTLLTRSGELLSVERKGPVYWLQGPARCVYRGWLPSWIWERPT